MKILKNVIVITFAVLNMSIAPEIYAADTDAGSVSEKVDAREMIEMGDDVLSKLGLSEGQKKQIYDNRIEDKNEMRILFANMVGYREALTTELMKPELDMDKINKIQASIKSAQNQITDRRFNSVIEVRKIMTLEQFKKYIELTDLRKDQKTGRMKNNRR